ncbi:hypothetical protein [Nonomuraea sp. MTCD27]
MTVMMASPCVVTPRFRMLWMEPSIAVIEEYPQGHRLTDDGEANKPR